MVQKKDKPLCGAKTRNGGLCKSVAGKGTDHLGSGRCKLHGGASNGAPKGNQNAKKHGIYARFFATERLDAAAEMLGGIDAELTIARLQLENLLEQMQADQFELKKLEVKTIALESQEDHEKKIKSERANDAERCGEYYDPDDDDFGLEQESQPVEVKRTREKPDWRTEFIRLTSLIAKLEKQRISIIKDKVIIAKVEKSDVTNELDGKTDEELDRELLAIATGQTSGNISEDEAY